MEHEEIKALLPLAALDRLDQAEQRMLEEHLGGCDECTAELREFRETAASLAFGLDPSATEERVWHRIEARLNPVRLAPSRLGDRQAREGSFARGTTLWRPAALVMTGVAAAASIYAVVMNSQLNRAVQEKSEVLASLTDEIGRLHTQLSSAQGQVATFQRVLDERLRLEKVLTQPDLRLTKLAPLKAAPPDASAIVAVSAANHAAMIQARGLPAPPAGKTYELWWITKESGPVAAGLFGAQEGASVVVQVSPPPAGEHVVATAVTLEPTGGVSKPTGAIYLKGT
jgi:anti-sigma-K factor RskA